MNRSQRLRVLERWIVRGLAVATAAAVIIASVQWLSRPELEQITVVASSLEAEWNDTISKLGIEPAYPPEEDLAVGDILAVVITDGESDLQFIDKKVGPNTPYLKRSVKLAHVDVRKDLAAAYEMLPIFSRKIAVPATPAQKQDPRSHIREPPASEPGLFMPGVPWRELPRAAFPSLTIQGRRSAAAGVSSGGQGSIEYGASTQGLEELQLFDVVTYGLPSARASAALLRYCAREDTKDDCLETTARKHLQSIVGSRIHNTYLDTEGNYQFAVKVGIVMVNRVYLTQSILHVRRSGNAQGGAGSVALRSRPKVGDRVVSESDEQSPPISQANATNASDPGAVPPRRSQGERQLSTVQPGGEIVYEASSGSEILLKEKFDRPVAIGYRSVAYEFPQTNKVTAVTP
jgi:hypothetical protein